MRLLVIRLGALGDIVLSFGPFAAIRAAHPEADITLLTTAPFAPLLAGAPWFDRILIDERPRPWNLPGLFGLRRRLRGTDFVYDLQTSGRSSRYHLLAGRPPWSGIAPGCSHPDDDPDRDRLHTIERQRGQLRRAGIDVFPAPDLRWLRAGAGADDREGRRVVLVPGAAPHRPAKRWPVASFAALASALASDGLVPVVVGGASDAPLGAAIARGAPNARDLTGRTDLAGLARVLAGAALAIGNDTGPMHLAAALGIPALVLFGGASDPALTAPRGPAAVRVLRAPRLAALAPGTVIDCARSMHDAARLLDCEGAREHLDRRSETA